MKHLFAIVAAFAMAAAQAGFSTLVVGAEDPVSLPARAVAFKAVSTNATGTVKVERIAPFTVTWQETETSTVTNYADTVTNLYRTVTNNHVTVWRTRYLGAGVVESNEYASAVNSVPDYPPWPGMVVTTNRVAESVSYTNWVVRIPTGSYVATNAVTRSVSRAWTNTLVNATLSGGIYTNTLNVLLWPGDRLKASGSALAGGEAVLMIEK